MYRCTGGGGELLTWSISGALDDFEFQRFVTPEGTVRREVISSAPVVFTVTEATASTISVTLTILDPVPLNGGRMECRRDVLQIVAASTSKYYLKGLTSVDDKLNHIVYILSSHPPCELIM